LILVMIPVAYTFIGGATPDAHEEAAADAAAGAAGADQGDDDWLPEHLRESGQPTKSLPD